MKFSIIQTPIAFVTIRVPAITVGVTSITLGEPAITLGVPAITAGISPSRTLLKKHRHFNNSTNWRRKKNYSSLLNVFNHVIYFPASANLLKSKYCSMSFIVIDLKILITIKNYIKYKKIFCN